MEKYGVRRVPGGALSLRGAARELGLRRGEFDLALELGEVRAVDPSGAVGAGGPRVVRREEITRLRQAPGCPDGLRERVRTVSAGRGAELLGISPTRFVRLARAGRIAPATFYLNRYRAVVWLYLVDELREFAVREPALLAGRTPPDVREALATGEDRRARTWRGRRCGRLLRDAVDPWERAAVMTMGLDPVQLAEVVDDPFERAYLRRLAPSLPASPEAAAHVLYADHPDDVLWCRVGLVLALDEARAHRDAPHPDTGPTRPRPPVPLPARPRRDAGGSTRPAGHAGAVRGLWRRLRSRPGRRTPQSVR
jgi:hypothetical protein